MFTGIIETLGKITDISINDTNRTFYIQSSISPQLKIDESVNHNGVCLTIEDIQHDTYRVTAIHETLLKTNASQWKQGDNINLERAMIMNGRLDGHIVQGHVDSTAVCIKRRDREGSVEFTFEFEQSFAHLVIEKGSVCINGISLTAFNITDETFTVAIIPYTLTHTNLGALQKDDTVNIEFDILGKYVTRYLSLQSKSV